MNDNVKKYSRQFFWYYLVGYFVGFAIIITANFLLHIRLQDIVLVTILCFAVPNAIAQNFVKNEKRYFNELEQRTLIKRASFSALTISMIPSFYYIAYCILMKLTFTPKQIPAILAKQHLSSNEILTELLNMNIATLIVIFLGAALVYYAIIRLMLGWSFKKLARKYGNKPQIKVS